MSLRPIWGIFALIICCNYITFFALPQKLLSLNTVRVSSIFVKKTDFYFININCVPHEITMFVCQLKADVSLIEMSTRRLHVTTCD